MEEAKGETLLERMGKRTGAYEGLLLKAQQINDKYIDKLDDDSQVCEYIKDVLKERNWVPYLIGDADKEYNVVGSSEEGAGQKNIVDIINKGRAEVIEPNKRYMLVPDVYGLNTEKKSDASPPEVMDYLRIASKKGKFPWYVKFTEGKSSKNPLVSEFQPTAHYIIDSFVYDGKELSLSVDKKTMGFLMNHPTAEGRSSQEMKGFIASEDRDVVLTKEEIGDLTLCLTRGFTERDHVMMLLEKRRETDKVEEKTPQDGFEVKS